MLVLDAASLEQVANALSPGSRVVRIQPLGGGLTALIHAIDVETASGESVRLVVRRARAPEDEGYDRGEREFLLLHRLFELRLPVPEPLWFGRVDGAPSLVMRRITGRPLLAPADPKGWAGQLARTMAAIHSVSPDRLGDLWRPATFGTDPEMRWDRWHAALARSGLLTERVEAAMARAPRGVRTSPPCLIHGDYWAGNTIWSRGRLRAVVDWEDAGFGSRGYDVAYCRLDIALSVGRRTEEDFLAAYREASGLAMEGQWFWDLLAADRPMPDPAAWIPAWHALGHRRLTPQLVRQRLRAFVERALREGGS
jgi:aminoglycoside phosphotransferase (APT) family kinase protein